MPVRFPLPKVTDLFETESAAAPIPGQATVLSGRSLVLVFQFEEFELIEKSAGKVIVIESSTPDPAEDGLAQTVPERGVFGILLESLKYD